MSYTNTISAPYGHGLMSKLRRLIDARRTYVADQRAMRQTYTELSAMNDRELADIGISRGDIRHIASQAVAIR